MVTCKNIIHPEHIDAVLFDLDGVVTKTAEIHAAAWKKLFDEFLQQKGGISNFLPFDIHLDYLKYVDGKPRYKGVEDFIQSRGIDLPHGSVQDTSDMETICGLGNRKNQIFSDILEKDGVKVYESSIKLIEQLRKNKVKIAIVSSSKNCHAVLKAANIEALFDVRVDGILCEHLGLSGKPEPDIFLEAAKRLDADVKRCVVVEDAISGVAAGKKGGFKMVIGVNRGDHAKELKQNGAHLVVDDLAQIRSGILAENLPHALSFFGKIMEKIEGKEIVVFIDYDSILSYLESLSENVSLRRGIKEILIPLANQCIVVLLTRKRLSRVVKRVTIDTVYYVGCDGYAMKGSFCKTAGPCDSVPDMSRDKGETITWFLEKLNLVSQSILPIYIGKSLTDDHGFEAVSQNGLGIALVEGQHCTRASFRLDSARQVEKFLTKLSPDLEKGTSWSHIYMGFDPKNEGRREALCALGNGYFVTRGAAPEALPCDVHYPGTYLAGVYNRLKTKIAGRIVENEDLVNLPNWLCLSFRIPSEEWFQLKDVTILFYRQHLNIKQGKLNRTIRFRDKKGRESILVQQSFVHGELMHLAGLKTIFTPLNWEGEIEVRSALDGRVANLGVERYRDLGNKHLELIDSAHVDENNMVLKMRTNQSCIEIAMGSKTRLFLNDQRADTATCQADKPGGYIARHFIVNVQKGESLSLEKLICIYTSRDAGISECLLEVRNTLENDITGFDELLKSHVTAWELLWQRFDVRLKLDDARLEQYTQKIIRLYIFHLLQSSSVHSLDIDVGMPARGWHGEGYRGHIFWDEMIIFPFLNYRTPRITRTLLMYRYRRLKEARRAARQAGFKGAMYPWQSGSNGREETQQLHLNPESGRWIPDNTYLQRHINTAIVYNIWQYFQITHDLEFLSFYGGEMIIEIARFWASIATLNPEIDRYEIKGVMGPDEYHDSYPGRGGPGIDNNAYTNIMVMFVMDQALNLQHVIPEQDWESLRKKLGVKDHELVKWQKMSRRMKLAFHEDGILSQFDGYENLKEFDWAGYKRKYGNIQRLDRILEKEGDSPNNYKLSKQADVLMLFYLFSAEKLKKLLKRLGYTLNKKAIPENINYYLRRTTNGSSMAMVIHAWIEARQARERSWKFFKQALQTDMVYSDNGSTQEGIHLAAMSGCIDILQRGYAGLEVRSDILILNPLLPKSINQINFHIRYRKHCLKLEITQTKVMVHSLAGGAHFITIIIKDEIIRLYSGKIAVVDL